MTDVFYFAPDQDCLTPLLNMINSAEEFILVADYSYNLVSLTDAIIQKHQAGVKVRMVLDRSQSVGKTAIPQIKRLKDAGVDVVIGTSDKHKIMHLKVAVADDRVAFGSYNFTGAAAQESNVLAIFEDPDLAKDFTTQIEKIYQWVVVNEPQVELNGKGIAMDYRDIVVRAAKTFGQAFLATISLSAIDVLHAPSLSVVQKLLLSAAVAGVSAVWNLVLVPLWQPVKAKLS